MFLLLYLSVFVYLSSVFLHYVCVLTVTRGRSFHQRLAQYSTTMEAIQARAEPLEIDEDEVPLVLL